jgi:hypothetical protein
MGSFVYFENATFMTDIYFSNKHTLVIKDISGDKRLVDTYNYNIVYVPGAPFTEIYIKPYWYSQPTNDTLFVHDKHGSKYLFDLGHQIQFMGRSENHLIFISPEWKDDSDSDCKGVTVCNTFW